MENQKQDNASSQNRI